MNEFIELFRSGFLLHYAVWGSIAVGIFCPLIGVYFMLRRMVLLGVALPQISAAGVSFAFFLQGLGISWTLHQGEANDRFLALAGSVLFTLGAILILSYLDRRGEGTTESRIGATYALAYAAGILLVSSNAAGKVEVLSMLQGEIVSVSSHDFHLLIAVYVFLGILLFALKDQFVLVSFDRQSAQVMGKNVMAWDFLLYAVIGIAISMSVLIVGPMLTFAYLIVPPLAARRFAKGMVSFSLISSAIGAFSAVIGFYISYHLDWPLSPTDIAIVVLALLVAFLIKKLQLLTAKRLSARNPA